jgi:hypothetical protein
MSRSRRSSGGFGVGRNKVWICAPSVGWLSTPTRGQRALKAIVTFTTINPTRIDGANTAAAPVMSEVVKPRIATMSAPVRLAMGPAA